MTDSDAAALLNQREAALTLAVDLEEVAAALRVIVAGLAGGGDVRALQEVLTEDGDLCVPGGLDWGLLFAHAADATA